MTSTSNDNNRKDNQNKNTEIHLHAQWATSITSVSVYVDGIGLLGMNNPGDSNNNWKCKDEGLNFSVLVKYFIINGDIYIVNPEENRSPYITKMGYEGIDGNGSINYWIDNREPTPTCTPDPCETPCPRDTRTEPNS